MKTKTQTQPWAVELQHRSKSNSARLCAVLRHSETDMFWFTWDSGMKFLCAQCGNDAWAIDMLKHESFYWNWFINQWKLRDEAFINHHELWLCNPDDLERQRIQSLRLAYIYHHAAALITDVMSAGYEQVLSKVVDREVREMNKPMPKHPYEYFLIKQ